MERKCPAGAWLGLRQFSESRGAGRKTISEKSRSVDGAVGVPISVEAHTAALSGARGTKRRETASQPVGGKYDAPKDQEKRKQGGKSPTK